MILEIPSDQILPIFKDEVIKHFEKQMKELGQPMKVEEMEWTENGLRLRLV